MSKIDDLVIHGLFGAETAIEDVAEWQLVKRELKEYLDTLVRDHALDHDNYDAISAALHRAFRGEKEPA